MLRSSLFVVLYLSLSLPAGYGQEAWMQRLTFNALTPPVNTGAYVKDPPKGFALYFSRAGSIDVPYLVYVPKGYNGDRPSQVVVFLHGAILARDSFQYKDPAVADEPIFSIADNLNVLVVFPFARADFAWGRNEKANENIISIIGQLERVYRVDKKRIYIGGISMGGNATYWFVNNKASMFAGFYAFSSMPREGSVQFGNITADRPLYTMNAKDDQTFSYSEAEAIYNKHKKEVPGWYFNSVPSGGHRFIYGDKGKDYIAGLLSRLLYITPR